MYSMKIIADSAIPFLQGVLEPWAQVRYIPGAQITSGDVHDADALVVRTRTRCDERLLAGSSVRMVATATIGFDHIDLPYCQAHDIGVATSAGCNARGVLQWVAAALVHLAQTQGWRPEQRTLGIVGVGHVGSLVKAYAQSWGFRVLCCDPPRQAREQGDFLPLPQVAAQADILTFHTPLDPSTHHLADAALLAHMKPHAVLINSSRGPVVDGRALLCSGHTCILDVWEDEPQPDPALLRHTLLATPHIAGYSEQGKAAATAMAVTALAQTFSLPLHNWYPPQAAPSAARPITWQELCTTIGNAYNIAAESREFKAHGGDFEPLRDNYPYRREYF